MTAYSIRQDLVDAVRATWEHVSRPGAVWTGRERVAIAAEVRRARAGEPPAGDLPPVAAEASRLLAVAPATARKGWVAEVAAPPLSHAHYVELLAVVSRVIAVDTLARVLGKETDPLPGAVPGDPSGEIASAARPGAGWVPMVGGTSITQALSLVPAENAELERLHGAMYLTFAEMADPGITRGLTRTQMELVAARTSALNECFY